MKDRLAVRGRRILFKSRIALTKGGVDQHYNRWYEIATIPEGVEISDLLIEAVATRFVAGGYKPLTHDEISSTMFALALVKDG